MGAQENKQLHMYVRKHTLPCATALLHHFFTAAQAMTASTARASASGTIIVDTDVGLDDVVAITLLVTTLPVRLITTTNGICQPGVGAAQIRQLVRDLAVTPAPEVVSGAEDCRREAYAQWECEQHAELSSLFASLGGSAAACAKPSAKAAADAILALARAKAADQGQSLTVLALGSMTNLGAAALQDPAAFAHIDRIVFVGGARSSTPGYHHQPYNAWLDPGALRTVLRSGVPLFLIGPECFPKLAWCSALVEDLVQAGSAVSATAPLAARVVWRILQFDARQMAFDPLAVFYLLQPEAFLDTQPMAVRVTEGEAWRFEECAAEHEPDSSRVVEFGGISLERYQEWLTRALGNDTK